MDPVLITREHMGYNCTDGWEVIRYNYIVLRSDPIPVGWKNHTLYPKDRDIYAWSYRPHPVTDEFFLQADPDYGFIPKPEYMMLYRDEIEPVNVGRKLYR